jgi:homoserine dehydrogenase
MQPPLRVGIAGLGTVGAAVLDILIRRAVEIGDRSGRAIEVTAVSARDRSRDRGRDLLPSPALACRAPRLPEVRESRGCGGHPIAIRSNEAWNLQ